MLRKESFPFSCPQTFDFIKSRIQRNWTCFSVLTKIQYMKCLLEDGLWIVHVP